MLHTFLLDQCVCVSLVGLGVWIAGALCWVNDLTQDCMGDGVSPLIYQSCVCVCVIVFNLQEDLHSCGL